MATAAGGTTDRANSKQVLTDVSVAVALILVLGGVYLVDSRTASAPPPPLLVESVSAPRPLHRLRHRRLHRRPV